MDNRLDHWTTQLANAALPPLEESRQQVGRLLDSRSSSNADLQQVIARDPGFALALFRTLHQLPNAPREPVSTLSHALSMLGTGQVSGMASRLPEPGLYPMGEPRRALLAGYARACHAAAYVIAWGRTLGLANTEELATAALFSDLAELLLWSRASREMEQRQLLIERGQSRTRAELTLFGFELDQLSRALAERWGLPPLVAQSLQPSGAFQQRSLMVMLAAALARESQQSWYSETTGELLELVAELNRTSLDRAIAQTHTQAAETARSLAYLPLPLSVSGLMLAAGEEAKTKPQKISRPQAALPPALIPDTSPPAPSVRADDADGTDRNRRLGRLLNDLKSHAGVERIMVATLNGDGGRLTAKYIVGADKSAPLRRFQHPASGRHLFSLLLKKPQGLWLNVENRQKLMPLLTEEALNTLNTDGFYMSSLFVKNRPVGIVYADRNDPQALDRQGFSQFKTLAQRLANELSTKR